MKMKELERDERAHPCALFGFLGIIFLAVPKTSAPLCEFETSVYFHWIKSNGSRNLTAGMPFLLEYFQWNGTF
ncbi:hypothetical protein ASG93_24600 [Paenibacillus sp. Soil787]|nr:hypothetical protein ASG93_24600 [Paenibacillus sp. Soil787]